MISNRCGICKSTVFAMDPHIKIDYILYHNKCAKCKECNTQIDITNFSFIDGVLYCKTHYVNKFKVSGGKYGDTEKFKISSTPSVAPAFQGLPLKPTVIEKKGVKKNATPASSGRTSAADELVEDTFTTADSELPSHEDVYSFEEGQEA